MKNIIKSLIFTSILLVLSAVQANEHETKDNIEEKVEDEQVKAVLAEEKNGESANSFVPTETISEDLSVPFPVDI